MGDVSLSNTLFRRDAGAFGAYLVDAETGDLTIARTNLYGEFSDLEAGGLLDESLDPLVLVDCSMTLLLPCSYGLAGC
jgi:hypothetical protein